MVLAADPRFVSLQMLLDDRLMLLIRSLGAFGAFGRLGPVSCSWKAW